MSNPKRGAIYNLPSPFQERFTFGTPGLRKRRLYCDVSMQQRVQTLSSLRALYIPPVPGKLAFKPTRNCTTLFLYDFHRWSLKNHYRGRENLPKGSKVAPLFPPHLPRGQVWIACRFMSSENSTTVGSSVSKQLNKSTSQQVDTSTSCGQQPREQPRGQEPRGELYLDIE